MSTITLNRLNTSNLRGDLSGGITAAVVALPLALAFGVASGAGPAAGLYGAVCVGLFAALFGGTPTQISGPTGPMTIVSASLFTQFGADPSQAFTVVMMAGAFQMLFGFLRIGQYVNLMPYPVISGFMTGIGVILILMQLDPLLGYAGPANVSNALSVLPTYALNPNWAAIVIGAISIIICFRTPSSLSNLVPAPLLALAVGTICVTFLSDVPVIGDIPGALPRLHLPTVDTLRLSNMLTTALVLAALGSIDSLLTSLAADNATATYHDSNKELVGQGIGNLAAGLVGGIAGAGATIRTLSNIKSGGATHLSGVIHAIVLLVIAIGMAPLVARVPHAALAGVLVKVGIDVIDWRFLGRVHRAPRLDLALMLIVLVLTVFVDVITAVGIGIVVASLAFVKEAADVQLESIHAFSDPDQQDMLTPEESELFRSCQGSVLMLHLSGLMSFGASNEMAKRFSLLQPCEVLLLDLIDVSRLDTSSGLVLEELIQRAVDDNQEVVVVGLNYAVARLLTGLGSLDLVKETHRFDSRIDGLRAALELKRRGQ